MAKVRFAEKARAGLRGKTTSKVKPKGKKKLAKKVKPAPKKKPYTNPDGTPFTREQMRKHLGR